MPICQYCGKQVEPGAAFCTNCGHGIQSAQDVQSTYPTSQPESGTIPVAARTTSGLLESNDIVLKKKILSITEHYDFESVSGDKLGEGDGNFFQFPAKFRVLDNSNVELMRIEGKLISLRRQFNFFDDSGAELGLIKKKIMKLFGDEYWVEQNGVETMRIYGNFTEHDYRMEVNKQVVATVHKKWVAIRDSFGISIAGPIDHRILIGSVIAIEHEEVTERRR